MGGTVSSFNCRFVRSLRLHEFPKCRSSSDESEAVVLVRPTANSDSETVRPTTLYALAWNPFISCRFIQSLRLRKFPNSRSSPEKSEAVGRVSPTVRKGNMHGEMNLVQCAFVRSTRTFCTGCCVNKSGKCRPCRSTTLIKNSYRNGLRQSERSLSQREFFIYFLCEE